MSFCIILFCFGLRNFYVLNSRYCEEEYYSRLQPVKYSLNIINESYNESKQKTFLLTDLFAICSMYSHENIKLMNWNQKKVNLLPKDSYILIHESKLSKINKKQFDLIRDYRNEEVTLLLKKKWTIG